MKIITWNCNMAFRKKAKLILSYQPDILVIPECEHPDKFNFDIDFPKPTSALWFGKNQNKGLGIFSYHDFELTVLDDHNENLRMIVPIRVNKCNINFNLFAIWANNPEDKDGQYVEQVWKALHHYDYLISQTNTILIGDFNSNTIWDKPRRIGNHSAVVKRLEDKGIYSVYHSHYKKNQGLEAHPTLYLYRHQNKPYHLDYCFVSEDLLQNLQSVEIGEYDYWTKHSDHVPIILTFKYFC